MLSAYKGMNEHVWVRNCTHYHERRENFVKGTLRDTLEVFLHRRIIEKLLAEGTNFLGVL